MAYAKTQVGAKARVKKKHFIRKCGLVVKSNATNKELNKLVKTCKRKIKNGKKLR